MTDKEIFDICDVADDLCSKLSNRKGSEKIKHIILSSALNDFYISLGWDIILGVLLQDLGEESINGREIYKNKVFVSQKEGVWYSLEIS